MPANISKHLDKNSLNNLHHAYLIEGSRDEVVPPILEFLKSIKVKVSNNPDFCHITLDSFKIQDARNLKAQASQKGMTTDKKVFLISANSFMQEAQNTMLKLFEEPIENTHFFIVVPDADAMLATLLSRFYVIRTSVENELKEAENFIKSSLPERINFIKELLAEDSDEEDPSMDSNRSKAKVFLNSLERALHDKIFGDAKNISTDINFFHQIFRAREFLRQSGSATKSLMEGVALIIPTK